MKWSERTSVEKAVLLLGLVCVAASAVLVVLDLLAVFECAYLTTLLFGVHDLSMAVTEKRKNMKILYYVVAAILITLGVLTFFF
jgi:hypothetical protein